MRLAVQGVSGSLLHIFNARITSDCQTWQSCAIPSSTVSDTLISKQTPSGAALCMVCCTPVATVFLLNGHCWSHIWWWSLILTVATLTWGLIGNLIIQGLFYCWEQCLFCSGCTQDFAVSLLALLLSGDLRSTQIFMIPCLLPSSDSTSQLFACSQGWHVKFKDRMISYILISYGLVWMSLEDLYRSLWKIYFWWC